MCRSMVDIQSAAADISRGKKTRRPASADRTARRQFQAEYPPYFYFRSSWPTDLESVSRDAYLTMNVSTKFEVDTTIRCLVIALLLLIRYVTLWPWPLTFYLGDWSYMAGYVVNSSTKFEYLKAIRSWVISSDISHRIPLTMRLQPLRMRRITWPMRSGKFFPHIWNPWPWFAISVYNFFGATIKIFWFLHWISWMSAIFLLPL